MRPLAYISVMSPLNPMWHLRCTTALSARRRLVLPLRKSIKIYLGIEYTTT